MMTLNALTVLQPQLSTQSAGVDYRAKKPLANDKQSSATQNTLQSAIVISPDKDAKPLSDLPKLKEAKEVSRSTYGLVLTELIYLLKKIDQDALKMSADGMVASKLSVDRKAASIRQEGVLNCASQVTGAVVQMGVSFYSFAGATKNLRKQNALDKEGVAPNKAKIDNLKNKKIEDVDKVGKDYQNKLDRLNAKHNEVNQQTLKAIEKNNNDIANLERNTRKIDDPDITKVDLKNHDLLELKRMDRKYLNREHKENLAFQRAARDSIQSAKNDDINRISNKYDNEMNELLSDTSPIDNQKAYNDAGNKAEQFRMMSHLSHPIGSIFSSSIAVAAMNERAAATLAELEASVDNKTTDNNRERSNSYKSTAIELLNSIKNILQDRTNAAGEIIRRC